jgi:hypothetical protein
MAALPTLIERIIHDYRCRRSFNSTSGGGGEGEGEGGGGGGGRGWTSCGISAPPLLSYLFIDPHLEGEGQTERYRDR